MYRILNKLFGWDYIYWKSEDYDGISKIVILPDKTIHFWARGYLINIDNKLVNIKFLTCTPDKYINNMAKEDKKYMTKEEYINSCDWTEPEPIPPLQSLEEIENIESI